MVRAEIESTNGKATVFRRDEKVVVEVDSAVLGKRPGRVCEFAANAKNPDECLWLARDLQVMLDGVSGTQGDIAEYVRVVECFAN
jgi:hypothetical protein